MANSYSWEPGETSRTARRALRVARSRHQDADRNDDGRSDEAWSRTPHEAPESEPEHQTPDAEPHEEPKDANAPATTRVGFVRRHPIVISVSVIALALAIAGGYVYWDYASHFETTDDAFIAARQFGIAPKVSGYISAVPVTDNQHVEAGQVIARIDDRDYRTALEQAQAQVEVANANVRNADAQADVQQAQIAQSQAQDDQAKASLTFAEQQASRYEDLAKNGAGSVQNAQQYTSSLGQQRAALKTADAAVIAAQRQMAALKAQRASAEANVDAAKAQLDQAQLNISYTAVRAAQPGRVVQLGAGVGQYAAAGSDLSMFVPDDLWVTGNFKETQLDRMRPGQPVTFEIDAYPEREVHGHVASVQPGSGTAFSLLPAQNATGNYVKIVQRVPVKIVLDNIPSDVAVGPGMSVEPSVRVDASPSLYERLRARL
jgi:membrane fusion protein (multidrug efflux system)